MPILFVSAGPSSGDMFRLTEPRVSIGRDPDNDLQFDDRTVSRYHALITEQGDGWYISDLESRNKTIVNGECVVARRLSHMDEIRLGNVVLAFLDQQDEAPDLAGTDEAEPPAGVTQTIRVAELLAFDARSFAHQSESLKQNQRLSHLLSLAELATSVKSLPILFAGLADSLRHTLGADRVIPMVEEEETLRPYLVSKGDFVDGLDGLDIDVSVVERSRQEGPTAATGGPGRTANVACAPIQIGPRNLGLIYCDTANPSNRFTDKDLRYLFSICLGAGMAIESIRSYQRMALRTESLSRQLAERYDMVGESEPMRAVYQFIRKVAPTEAGVLICGESGTGKELVARAIHHHSRRSDGPLEVVNCAAMPPTLIESELFGHVRGAFTGAVADKPGRFELADGGALFLDEVVELSPECQTKLLRVLEQRRIRRLGDTQDRTVAVRLIAATNRSPDEEVTQGRLRPDLFYRLDRLRIVVPPLRTRGDDIPLLAHHFLEEFSRQCKRTIEGFAPEVLEVFSSYGWPGNVRELQNVIERMVILGDGPVLGPELVPGDLKAAALTGKSDGVTPLSELEKEQIVRTLQQTRGNKTRAAQMLGIDRSTLYAKLKRYEIDH